MRIRTIKPEFWTHEGLCGCSEFTRLLAIALLNWSDDEGYFMANPILIRGQVFPFLDDSKIIPRSLQDLSSVGWIRLGKDNQGRSVGMVVNFSKHQRVDKPKPSEIKASSTFQDQSKNDLGSVLDESKEERKGKERNGKEGIPPNPQGGILPDGWKRLTKAEQGRKKVNFNDPVMIRVGKFLGQRETTLWTIAEYLALQDVNPSEEDLDLIGEHYSLVLENNGYRYKDLYTLLNNWPKARTRAEAYFQEFPSHRAA